MILTLEKALSEAIRKAPLTAHDLYHVHEKLLDLLIPGESSRRGERSLAAEKLIRDAIAAIGEKDGVLAHALLITLGLQHPPDAEHTSTFGRSLTKRRREASKVVGVTLQTFSKSYEKRMISALAFEIVRIQLGNQESQRSLRTAVSDIRRRTTRYPQNRVRFPMLTAGAGQ